MKTINRDNLPHLVWCLHRLLRTKLDSFIVRILAHWWGVSLGKNCEFRGFPIIRRLPGSRITIGDGCAFHSAPDSNQGGISRRCILWTLNEKAQIAIGDGCGFSGTVINAQSQIRIGKGVRCGTNTHIMDSDMHIGDFRVCDPEPVAIEDNVWLGMYSTVLKGVTIGEGTLVAAYSMVNKSLPGNVLAAGIPARVIREFNTETNNQKGKR